MRGRGHWAIKEQVQPVTTHHPLEPVEEPDSPSVRTNHNHVAMETMQELIPFAKEMLSQKPGRGLLKVYLVGSMFAVVGTVIGLAQALCYPFMSDESMDVELVLALAQDQRTVQPLRPEEEEETAELVHQDGATVQTTTLSKTPELNQRSSGKRQHAS